MAHPVVARDPWPEPAAAFPPRTAALLVVNDAREQVRVLKRTMREATDAHARNEVREALAWLKDNLTDVIKEIP
jgi:hypothetical protein